MPNATVRANARTMSKANPPEHNDAALIALVNECIAAETALDKQNEAMDEAERQQRDIATPKGIFRTESDLQMGLFAGRDGIGKPYDIDDIERLRPLVRRKNRESCSTIASFKEGQRADDILEQWRDWQHAIATEETKSGYRAASVARHAAADEHDRLLEKLARTQPRTLDGVLAKARAFQNSFGVDDSLVKEVDDQIDKFGPDQRGFGSQSRRRSFSPRSHDGGLTMTNILNRRAALGSIAAAGAMLAAPAAIALGAHPDAELIALQSEIDSADREFSAVLTNLSRCQERFYDLSQSVRSP
jgi:hypothetical protein